MKHILLVLAIQILVAGGIILAVESCTSNNTINEDGSLNPIEIDAVVLFHNSRWNMKTVQYCGHRYIMTKHAIIHDPDCPCYEVGDEHHEY